MSTSYREARAHDAMALSYLALDRPSEAMVALKIGFSSYRSPHPDQALSYGLRARAPPLLGDGAAARLGLERGRALLDGAGHRPLLLELLRDHMLVLEQLGCQEEAAAERERAALDIEL